jgi:glycosyltransferase involved in cell wall biosynthesis
LRVGNVNVINEFNRKNYLEAKQNIKPNYNSRKLEWYDLKILHLSDMQLPDWRIEKSGFTDSRLGHDVVFAGMNSNYEGSVFSEIFLVHWTPRARRGMPFYWRSVKKQLEGVLKETRPDLVHAHNIFSAKMVSEFGIPFVYDDHEFWPIYVKRQSEVSKQNQMDTQVFSRAWPRAIMRKFVRDYLTSRAIKLWTNWEREIVSAHPTITVSDQIAEQLRTNYRAKNVFVVPNFPMYSEVKDFENPHFIDRLSSVYAGGDGHNIDKYPNRNIDDLDNAFLERDIGSLTIIGWSDKSTSNKVRYTGFLSRQDMFREMFNHSIGLIPWKRHWTHNFVSPNKAYEYAHAGLVVACTSSLNAIKQILKEHCITFDDYEDMAKKLMYFKENLDDLYSRRLKIYDYARANLIWEKNEKLITEAYKRCT